jgi:aminoglycoside/choline kinase family phosphotransferase
LAKRATLIYQFLQTHGWADAERHQLPGDASFRRYIRLNLKDKKALVMDAPPPLESVQPFVSIARHLCALGFSAPEIIAEDVAHGLLLIEDFGEDTFTHLLNNGANEEELYTLATDTLIELHRKPGAIPENLAPYNDFCMIDEAALFADWYLPAIDVSPSLRKGYAMAWFECFHLLGGQPQTVVLRDYHVNNLMRLSGRNGIQACGLLDFQDALAGPSAYDVMSLLDDARRDIAEPLRLKMLNRYCDAFPKNDRAAFETAFAILGAQRHAKVIGIFTRLCWRDNKTIYLKHIPRVWRLLERSLQHPALFAVASWFDLYIPTAKRIIPPKPSDV